MTSRMVRWRSVSAASTACNRPSATAPPELARSATEGPLLSLMSLNVTAPEARIKHVFDQCVATAFPAFLALGSAESQVCNFSGDRVSEIHPAGRTGKTLSVARSTFARTTRVAQVFEIEHLSD